MSSAARPLSLSRRRSRSSSSSRLALALLDEAEDEEGTGAARSEVFNEIIQGINKRGPYERRQLVKWLFCVRI